MDSREAQGRDRPAADGRPTKLLVVIGQLDVGGAERHLAQVLPRLRSPALEVTVFVLKPGGALAPELEQGGVRVVSVPGRRAGIVGLLQSAVALWRTLRRARPDIVHFFLPAAYFLGTLCTFVAPPARRVMSRRSLATYHVRHPWARPLERLFHRHMDFVLGNSRAVVAGLGAEGVPATRLGLIYNGIEPARDAMPAREAARAALDLPADAFVLVMVANLIPYKGHAELLAALGAIKNRLPAPWTLLCCGRDDGIGTALAAQAAALGIGHNVRWLGAVADVLTPFAAADVGVLASHEEGFSNAVLEGMAAGLPMVVTAVGGNPEAVADGETGYVVPARNPAALAEAIARLAGDPALRTRFGAAALLRVEQEFSLAACVARYAALYGDLMAGRVPALSADAR